MTSVIWMKSHYCHKILSPMASLILKFACAGTVTDEVLATQSDR